MFDLIRDESTLKQLVKLLKMGKSVLNLPFNGLISPFEWCDEALELGVVETVEIGEPGLISFGVVFPPPLLLLPDFPSALICESEELLLVTFCWASRSCLRNFARLFWNQT